MGKPTVAIIGRPNVGKSTLFNRLVGKRIAIVEDIPGVTRDRLYWDVEWAGKGFTIIDTGGILTNEDDMIISQIKKQAEIAIEVADILIFVVDGKEGVTAEDKDIALLLRKSKKPIVLVCNKIDTLKEEEVIYEFYNLGMGMPMPVSSSHGKGIGDMLDVLVESFAEGEQEEEDDSVKVALIGKPNVGKSSIVNRLLGEERVIVTDIPGTTRDAIDTPFSVGDKNYILIDTAGMRKKGRVDEELERYSVLRALGAIRKADVCLIVIDAEQGISEQDSKIAGYVHDEGRASIIIVNKWDLIEKDNKTIYEYKKSVYSELPFLTYAPVMFISAKTGQRVDRILKLVDFVVDQYSFRISTGVLNDIINEAITIAEPPSKKGKRLKIYYCTQVSTKPPTYLFFINDKELVHFSYERYLENQLRKTFGLEGTPIRLIFRERKK